MVTWEDISNVYDGRRDYLCLNLNGVAYPTVLRKLLTTR